ncbi:MAG: hypothetical protein CMD96_08230 [Gammaproteobacteria bacterium]|jgi:hypothetical protein|nr:hypothetical protein [Gammaproteobacteria bacterium]HJP19418.1 hypothetical protein [Nitrospinota bacterium]|tara:strand:- start:1692 stop:1877 length:186 start_codon:yes stop_codon:yes gene_type:complete
MNAYKGAINTKIGVCVRLLNISINKIASEKINLIKSSLETEKTLWAAKAMAKALIIMNIRK